MLDVSAQSFIFRKLNNSIKSANLYGNPLGLVQHILEASIDVCWNLQLNDLRTANGEIEIFSILDVVRERLTSSVQLFLSRVKEVTCELIKHAELVDSGVGDRSLVVILTPLLMLYI